MPNNYTPRPRIAPIIWIALFIAILAIAGTVIFAVKYFKARAQLSGLQAQLTELQKDPAIRIKEENKALLIEVAKLITLPTDEDPTIATVTDLSKLQSQPFFVHAQLGDKVLIYSKAKKAIIYRPSLTGRFFSSSFWAGAWPSNSCPPFSWAFRTAIRK